MHFKTLATIEPHKCGQFRFKSRQKGVGILEPWLKRQVTDVQDRLLSIDLAIHARDESAVPEGRK